MTNEKPKYPSIWKMIASFTMALVDHVKAGGRVVSASEYAQRIRTCNACPHLIRESFRCGKCGCLLEHKAKWTSASCPDEPKRWDSTEPLPEPPPNER